MLSFTIFLLFDTLFDTFLYFSFILFFFFLPIFSRFLLLVLDTILIRLTNKFKTSIFISATCIVRLPAVVGLSLEIYIFSSILHRRLSNKARSVDRALDRLASI